MQVLNNSSYSLHLLLDSVQIVADFSQATHSQGSIGEKDGIMHKLLDLQPLPDDVILDAGVGEHVRLHVERIQRLDVVLFDHFEFDQVAIDKFQHDLELVELLKVTHLVGKFVADALDQLHLLPDFLFLSAN